eukprot:NODE_4520_length_775_cov_23.069444_g4361_i0.p1 GENE.NODE_4520_length_775_cov_23.069444_g4361_i0~~NODE_4520_length_775_cov_23.069444_g4361_i0.p1  ORF type:complete len:220 (-),score=78.83 NODE_4520_length_775_cov_23.069444_g4361_i0:115-738(-)
MPASLVWDANKHKEFVLGFRKRKEERRKQAQIDISVAAKKKLQQEKRMKLEDSRMVYNRNCQVPILHDFTLATPEYLELNQQTPSAITERSYARVNDNVCIETHALEVREPISISNPHAPTTDGSNHWVRPQNLHHVALHTKKGKDKPTPKKMPKAKVFGKKQNDTKRMQVRSFYKQKRKERKMGRDRNRGKTKSSHKKKSGARKKK